MNQDESVNPIAAGAPAPMDPILADANGTSGAAAAEMSDSELELVAGGGARGPSLGSSGTSSSSSGVSGTDNSSAGLGTLG